MCKLKQLFGADVSNLFTKQILTTTTTTTSTTATSGLTTTSNVLVDSFSKVEHPILSPSSSVVRIFVNVSENPFYQSNLLFERVGLILVKSRLFLILGSFWTTLVASFFGRWGIVITFMIPAEFWNKIWHGTDSISVWTMDFWYEWFWTQPSSLIRNYSVIIEYKLKGWIR